MKKVILLVATIATLGFVSCTNASQKAAAEKATQDSLIEAARLDSIAKVEAEIKAAAEAAAAAADTLKQAVEEAVPAVK